MRVLHLMKHCDMGGITRYVMTLAKELHGQCAYCGVVSAGGAYEEAFHALGVETCTVDIAVKSILHPKVFAAVDVVSRLVREKDITIMHAHTRVAQVVAHFVSRRTGVPFIATCHGFFTRNIGRRLLPAWGKKVIAISDAVHDDLVTRFDLAEDRVRTIYNGIDVDALETAYQGIAVDAVREHYRCRGCYPVIGAIARMVKDKGFQCLVRAAHRIRERYPSLVVLLIGEGKYEQALRSLVDSLGMAGNVRFLGIQSNIAEPLSTMDVFVVPTLTREGFGFSAVEALALKKTVIAADLGGLRTVIRQDENGVLFRPGDDRDLAEKICWVLDNRTAVARFHENGYRRTRELFSSSVMAASVFALYRECVSGREQ